MDNGQCTRVLQGYAVSLLDVDWSPDGGRLVSAGSNSLVTIWDADAGAAPVELRGHQWIVQGVAWSPASQIVASCGWDNSIRLWDAATSTPDQILSDADDPIYFFCVAWSADGQRLAAGTYMHGVLA